MMPLWPCFFTMAEAERVHVSAPSWPKKEAFATERKLHLQQTVWICSRNLSSHITRTFSEMQRSPVLTESCPLKVKSQFQADRKRLCYMAASRCNNSRFWMLQGFPKQYMTQRNQVSVFFSAVRTLAVV